MTPLVGRRAPDFTADAVWADDGIRPFTLSDVRGRHAVLIFYPLDFSSACPSELLAFERSMPEFARRAVDLVACSIDSAHVHLAWKRTPCEQGGVGALSYPLVSDLTHEVVRAYGVEGVSGAALRATFVIDREGVVQYQRVSNLGLALEVHELLRVLDAVQQGEVRPDGWQEGRRGAALTERGAAAYLAEHSDML
ncbi:peroxiredoxin [Methyloversatilis thermotolerans]|uniref:peroxiredoxin n=1 Tax=Methyloversatilis thermotolerans TaxID=1346290 RepID=UPI00037325EB|nr:peroxiredoxin [Methyloversatilis thermotolerans]